MDTRLTPSQLRALRLVEAGVREPPPAEHVTLRWLERNGLRKAALDMVEREFLSMRTLPNGAQPLQLTRHGRAALDAAG